MGTRVDVAEKSPFDAIGVALRGVTLARKVWGCRDWIEGFEKRYVRPLEADVERLEELVGDDAGVLADWLHDIEDAASQHLAPIVIGDDAAISGVEAAWMVGQFILDAVQPARGWFDTAGQRLDDFGEERRLAAVEETKRRLDEVSQRSFVVIHARVRIEEVACQSIGPRATPPDDRETVRHSMLKDWLDCHAGTISGYARQLGLPVPRRGDRQFEYPVDDAMRILRYARDNGGILAIREAATIALETHFKPV